QALYVIVIMTIWGWTGFAVVIYLAALQGVPKTLTEAAAIDGAGAWTTFRRVTLPLLSPASLFLAVWLTINALQLFDEVYLSTQGGPLNATTVLVFPFAWLLITSVESSSEALHFPPVLIPHHIYPGNYKAAWQAAPFGRFFLNSAVVAVVTVLSNLVLCSLAGYAFARFRF